jgi:hypothetical protein
VTALFTEQNLTRRSFLAKRYVNGKSIYWLAITINGDTAT